MKKDLDELQAAIDNEELQAKGALRETTEYIKVEKDKVKGMASQLDSLEKEKKDLENRLNNVLVEVEEAKT